MGYLAQSEFARLVDGGMVIPLVAIVLGCATGMVAIIATAMTRATVSRHREQTRREVAAYVAEGTISPHAGRGRHAQRRQGWGAARLRAT